MFCMPCGKEICDESVFCHYCGKKLGTSKVDAEIPKGWEYLIFMLHFRWGEDGSASIKLESYESAEGNNPVAGALGAVASIFWWIRNSCDNGAVWALWRRQRLSAQILMNRAQLDGAEPY